MNTLRGMLIETNFSGARLGRMKDVLGAYVERGDVPGLVALVARRGEVHVEVHGVQNLETRAPMKRDTIFRIASMSKPVTAVAAMMLVEEAKMQLDDPVENWLPELANRQVLRSIDGPLQDTVPASRSITVRDLLTFRMGIGAIMAPPGRYPIQASMAEAGLSPGPLPAKVGAEEWLQRLSSLPLISQPGEQWLYHTGSDVLGVLISRVAEQPFEAFVQERIFDPLGMKDTNFYVPQNELDRLATSYRLDGSTGRLVVYDEAAGGRWSAPPAFASGGGGLVSTADDYEAFGRMWLNFGHSGNERLLSRRSIELMTLDHITPTQKAASPFAPGFWETYGWGFGVSVVTNQGQFSESPGSYGWDGGFGTGWRNDPREAMTCILLTQRMMRSPNDTRITGDLLTLAYQAIND